MYVLKYNMEISSIRSSEIYNKYFIESYFLFLYNVKTFLLIICNQRNFLWIFFPYTFNILLKAFENNKKNKYKLV